jgi:hypothetical protein
MAERRPRQMNKQERAELYRQFLEEDAQSLRIIIRHAGQSVFISARPEAATKGQVMQLLSAVAETQRRSDSPRDVVWHGDSLFQKIRNVFGDTT